MCFSMKSVHVFMESDMETQTFLGIISTHSSLITEEVVNQCDES